MGKYDQAVAVLKLAQAAIQDRHEILMQLGLYSTLDAQLRFLVAFFSGKGGEHERLHDINVGLVSLREIESFDSELAGLLNVAQYIAHKKAYGLKMDPGILEKYLKEKS